MKITRQKISFLLAPLALSAVALAWYVCDRNQPVSTLESATGKELKSKASSQPILGSKSFPVIDVKSAFSLSLEARVTSEGTNLSATFTDVFPIKKAYITDREGNILYSLFTPQGEVAGGTKNSTPWKSWESQDSLGNKVYHDLVITKHSYSVMDKNPRGAYVLAVKNRDEFKLFDSELGANIDEETRKKIISKIN